MKVFKILVSLLFFISPVLIKAQIIEKALVFSQVKLVSTSETVPEGKVWKVERVVPKFKYGTKFVGFETSKHVVGEIVIDTERLVVESMTWNDDEITPFASNIKKLFDFPLWLPEGTTLEAGAAYKYISVIEFSVKVTNE